MAVISNDNEFDEFMTITEHSQLKTEFFRQYD
jgi:hypothetical protein